MKWKYARENCFFFLRNNVTYSFIAGFKYFHCHVLILEQNGLTFYVTTYSKKRNRYTKHPT